MTDYTYRLLHFYPSFTLEHVDKRLPMDEGWIAYNYAIENDAMLQFNGIRRESKGYVAQEIQRCLNAK